MCDSEEDIATKKELRRRSFIVRTLVGFSLGVLGFFTIASQRLRPSVGSATPIKGGPYTMPKPDGKYTFVDVAESWNDVGITKNSYKSLSNFDEDGKAFAQEVFPPSVGPNLAVISCPKDGVRFVLPDQADKVMNVIKCQSQRVDVPPGHYSKIHFFGASIRGSKGGVKGFLRYEGGNTSEFDLILDPWRGPSTESDVILHVQKIYFADGSEVSGPDAHAYLYHGQVACDPTRALQRIILPSGCHCDDHDNCACKISDIRVLAITLES